MAAATKSLQYRVGMDIGELRRKGAEAGQSVRAFRRELDELEKKQRAHRKTLEDMGRGMATFGAAVLAGLGLAAKAAIDWESAWTGVRKTVDGSDKEMAALEGELRQLARTLPASHREIAAVAEAAGQLGIKRKDIAGFTKTMVDLGETTNLTADEAATALAKFSNIMGTSASQVDQLGSALVALGNDGASTERDIVEMALRIAGAGKVIHLTEAQVLAFASALSSVGIEAEAGGSSISRVMVDISSAVTDGGAKLETFAAVAGMTGAEFAEVFRTDAAGAVIAFIQGLGRMQKSGEDVFGTLEELGFSEVRVRDALLRAGSASDMFTKALKVGSAAWAENTALTEEANKRYATSASQIKVAWNQIQDALIDVGAAVAPVVSSVTTGVADAVRAFQSLPGPVRDVVTWVGAAAGGIGLLGGAALIAGPKIMAFREKMTTMVATGGAASRSLGRFGLLLAGPVGLALTAGSILFGILAAKIGETQRKQAELDASAKSIAETIKEQNYQINEAVIAHAAKEAAEADLLVMARQLGIEEGKITEAVLGQGTAFEDVMRIVTERRRKMQEDNVASILTEEGRALLDMQIALVKLHFGTKKGIQANRDADAETRKLTESQKELGRQYGMTDEQVKKAADALDQMVQALDDTNRRTLNARSAEREFLASVAEVKASVEAAAEARVQAAERVEAAERDLANAQRSTKSAQDALTGAQRDARDAQLALTRAREEEIERLEDLNRAVKGAALDEEAAVLAVARARERLEQARTEGAAGLDLAEAELGVRQAEQALADTRDRYGDVRKEADAANRAGVEGSDAVISAQRGVADAQSAVVQAQQGVADAALEVRDALREVARAHKELDMQGNSRTLDQNTEAGRRNAAMLDRVADNALALAAAAAREAEKVGGAAAGAAALTASLKASRPMLIDTALSFGMSREEAERFADSVLAVPDMSSVLVVTPGSREAQAELERVRQKVYGVPPKWDVNVGVLSQAAVQTLENLGYRVTHLPNGQFVVSANDANAWNRLNNLVNTFHNRRIDIYVSTYETFARTGGQPGRYYAARGGIVSFAGGGMMSEDHRPQIARARPGLVRMWAEPETGRESYIPWAMDRRKEATGVLRATAAGFGYGLVPRSRPVQSFAYGSGGSVSGGVLRGQLEWVGPQSDIQRFFAQMMSKYVRVKFAGDADAAFGRSR